MIGFIQSDDAGAVRDMQRLIKSTGVKGIKDLSGDALMGFARDALAIMHPEPENTPKKPWPPVSEGPINPNGKGWITFDEACLPQEDRGPEYLSGVELDLTLKVLSVARAKLDEDTLREVLFAFTGEQAFCAATLKVGEGPALCIKLLEAVKAVQNVA